MLIGASIFPHLLLSNKVQGQPPHVSPLALETVLGYVIVGDAPVRVDSHESVSYCCTADPLDSVIRKFWELEEVDAPPVLSPDDKFCEDFYSSTTSRASDGRYVVALPFKVDVSCLGNSRQASERRFYCLERKMQASPQLKIAYDNVIREYLEKDYISPINCNSSQSSYFIPHHGVIREDKVTTKLRVVLDGSCKTSTGFSLNDLLYRGENLQGSLFNIINNFRLFSIALSADIRQMFLSIGIRESDRRFQRILYRFSPQQPLQVYEFNRVVFGLKSSPFHALRTIKQLAADEGASFPQAREVIDTSLYIDDFVYSVPSEELGISTASELISLMKAGQFELVKWSSNSQVVLDSIPPSHRLPEVKEFDESDQHKILASPKRLEKIREMFVESPEKFENCNTTQNLLMDLDQTTECGVQEIEHFAEIHQNSQDNSQSSRILRSQKKQTPTKKVVVNERHSYDGNIRCILEKLDTTLVEIHHNTDRRFIKTFVETQKRFSELKRVHHEVYEETLRDLNYKFKRLQDMSDAIFEEMISRMRDVITEDRKQNIAMVKILKEDVQAVVDFNARRAK
ncbi:uncharacterized protein LOC123723000 [Papilio machaon]|uniref:uncharacterized protein LOC123723000 n=1 Tax=Papilio machaon TaxID=76193 RepID=UPI001E663A0C|nr:uncharacterized protein LOC123723000 [Papilio machaon]